MWVELMCGERECEVIAVLQLLVAANNGVMQRGSVYCRAFALLCSLALPHLLHAIKIACTSLFSLQYRQHAEGAIVFKVVQIAE